MTPVVSVIVPVYNAAAYLQQCIESILGQTGVALELILVDDGSTDGSTDICLRTESARYVRTGGVGVSAARNAGLDVATGKWITFVDADDELLPGALTALLAAATPAVDIVAGRFTRQPRLCHATEHPRAAVVLSPEQAIEATLYQREGFHESACAKIYRRSILELERFVAGRRYEDLEFTPRVYAAARAIAFIDAVVYYYRTNRGSFINTWSSARLDALWAADTIAAFVAARFPALTAAARSRAFSAYYNIYIEARRAGRADVAAQCLNFIRRHRRAIAADGKVRIKNKIGAFATLLLR